MRKDKQTLTQTPVPKGYSLLEMAMVLAIIGILFSLGLGVWKSIQHYIRLQQIQSAFADLTAELEISAENSEKLLACLTKKKHQKLFLIFSDFFLKEFPSPCYYDRELSPIEDDYPLMAGNENIAWALISPGPNNNYQFGHDGANELIVPDFRKKADLFPLDGTLNENFDDFTFLPTFQRLRLKQGCKRPPQAAIDYLAPQKRITTEPTIDYTIVYPASYDLLVQADGFIRTYREPTSKLTIPIALGLNRISFGLLKNNEIIYKRYDYVARAGAQDFTPNAETQNFVPLTFNATLTTDNAPTKARLQWNFDDHQNHACIIDFDDGYYKFFPICNRNYVTHLYAAQGEYRPVIVIDNGTNIYVNATNILLYGNEKPTIDVDLDVAKVVSRKNKKMLEERISLHATVDDDNESLSCRLYYDSKLLTKTKNCNNLSFTGYATNASLHTFKIAVDDKDGARTIKAFSVNKEYR